MSKTTKPDLPQWFDPARHSPGQGGIIETATNTLLDDDGQPLSKAVAMARKAIADLEAETAPAAEPETQPTTRRNTQAILAAHVAAEPKE